MNLLQKYHECVFAGPPEFDNHVEMLKFAFNSISASGRLDDGLNLVRSQKRMVAFNYQFATQEGTSLSKSVIYICMHSLGIVTSTIFSFRCCPVQLTCLGPKG